MEAPGLFFALFRLFNYFDLCLMCRKSPQRKLVDG